MKKNILFQYAKWYHFKHKFTNTQAMMKKFDGKIHQVMLNHAKIPRISIIIGKNRTRRMDNSVSSWRRTSYRTHTSSVSASTRFVRITDVSGLCVLGWVSIRAYWSLFTQTVRHTIRHTGFTLVYSHIVPRCMCSFITLAITAGKFAK